MESGMWWRTRTVAEGMATGTFLRLSCGCGRITDYPFSLLLQQRRDVTRDTFIGNIAFKGGNCGRTDPTLDVRSQSQAPSFRPR
jgi:hypothetical protein